jgi:hypothetical protein
VIASPQVSGPQQIPILCARCAGSAELGLDGTVTCGYCGARDRLPDDALARALELKRRVRVAAESMQQLQGVESTLGHVFESRWAFLRASGFFLVVASVVLVYALAQAWPMITAAPPGLRPTLVINMLIGPMFVAGIALSICAALLVGRASYRRRVRPLLFARPPRQVGAPCRCRACDAPLPDRRDPLVQCEFCGTQSLVTPEVQRDRERLLLAEQRFYQSRGGQIAAATTRGSLRMNRVFALAMVLVYGSIIGLAHLGSALLTP